MTGPIANANPFRFSTKYQDNESDLLYYGLRYYNPSTEKWLTRDPVGEIGGANLYGFVGNSPICNVDYIGLYGQVGLPTVDIPGMIGSVGDAIGAGAAAIGEIGLGAVAGVAGAGVVAGGLVGYDAYQLNQINQLNQQNQQTAQQIAEKQQDYLRYKNRCNQPTPPGLDACSAARWKLQRNKDCKQLREEYANKWFGGNYDKGHADQMQQLDRANKNLEDWIARNCKPCP